MPSTCEGVPLGQRVAEPGSETQSSGHRGAQSGAERLQGLGVQEWLDGSRYEGEFVNGLKHGKGSYSWRNGESYEGYFYKDYKHGDGTYYWPTGHKFIGKFYLNRKEGYGKQMLSDGATFQGLYHTDQRFGPGVFTDPDGCEDVGLWLGEQLLKLCTSVEEGFSLKSFPEYATYMDPANNTDLITQLSTEYTQTEERTHCKLHIEGDLLPHEVFILPPEIEIYSTDGDHLPLPPGRRRELDQQFYGKLWEPDAYLHQGYERDPLSTLPLQSRMQAHIYKHRQQAKNVGWDVAAVLSLNRESFGPKGLLEMNSELLIQHASRGNLQAVSQILQTGLVHPDVADSRGHTALIAATVNCHNNVIHLLLDMGADIDKLNCEGMSALAVCHVLYYPFQSLRTTFVQLPAKTQALRSSACGDSPLISQVDLTTKTPRLENRPQTNPNNETNNSPLSKHHYTLIAEHKVPETSADTKHMQEEGKRGNKEEEEEGEERECTDGEEGVKVLEERDENKKEDGKWEKSEMESTQENGELNENGRELRRMEKRDEGPEFDEGKDKEKTHTPTFDSSHSVSSCNIQNTERVTQRSAEKQSYTRLPQLSETHGTERTAAAMKIESPVRLKTLKLLLERGADPNVCRVPVPVLFLAIMAADPEAVRRLLLCGARTDVPLPPEKKGLYPLHVAAALPGAAGPAITELLLYAVADPDKEACDQDEIYEPDKIDKPPSMNKNHLETGGRTALHVACQREGDYKNASKIVALLLSHGASTDLLWSGHSPLSLAIASGNDLAVKELLKGGANPNLPLGLGVGSALCVLANFKYRLDGNRAKLLDMLAKAGADFLMPVKVGNTVGNAVDYAHHSFNQDLRIGQTPFHALNMQEREIFKTRRHLLSMMGDLLRETACKRLQENLDREQQLKLNRSSNGILESLTPITVKDRNPEFRFCYYCGRSVSVKLTACGRCRRVFFCSKDCKLNAWGERHKQECVKELSGNKGGSTKTQQTKTKTASKPCPRSTKVQIRNITPADGIKKSVVFQYQGGSRSLTATLKPKTAPMTEELRHQRLPEPSNVVEVENNLKENYSHN